MRSRNCIILVGTHKPYSMPEDTGYLPLHLGSALTDRTIIGTCRDDIGANISNFNPYFCELTGLYWAWKNTSAQVYGLVHYRRYFEGKGLLLNGKRIASSAEILAHM